MKQVRPAGGIVPSSTREGGQPTGEDGLVDVEVPLSAPSSILTKKKRDNVGSSSHKNSKAP